MQKLSSAFKQLHASIISHKVDFQLVQNLKQTLASFALTQDEFLQFVKVMTQVYELSNYDKLYQIKRNSISISEMAIELKILVCKMMTLMILYFEKQQSADDVPLEILGEAVQIMVVCSRVCLNEGSNKYISLIQEYYKFVHSPYDLVGTTLKKDIQFLHHVNALELMRFKCENQSFSVLEFSKRLLQVASFEQYQLAEYKGFVQNILMEVLLKSIKNGKLKPDGIQQFYTYLSEQNRKEMNSLVFDAEKSMTNLSTGSEFLQIYKQVKSSGIASINIEFLEDFIKNEKNFNDERVFEIAALTLQTKILQIWFTVLNTRKQKSPLIEKALMCFIHLVDSIMYSKKHPSPQTLEAIVKLSNSVAFAMLTEKKTSFANQPVLHIIKTFVKVLTFVCFSLYEHWGQIKDFGDRTVLLCSRYQCMEVTKVVYAVLLYYCLVKRIKAEEIYQKFTAHHTNQKSSQIYKLLSCAYDVQASGEEGVGDLRVDEGLKLQMRRKPFVAILFAKRNEDMTIFQIDSNQFKQVRQKFYIYAEMLKKYRSNGQNVVKILSHLEDLLIKTSVEQFQAYLQVEEQENVAVQEVYLMLVEMLEGRKHANSTAQGNVENLQNRGAQHMLDFLDEVNIDDNIRQDQTLVFCQIGFILINLYMLGSQQIARSFNQSGFGVLLNKYSSKVKMVSAVGQLVRSGGMQLDADFYNISCTYMITVLGKFKKLTIQKERIGEPGEVAFVHAVAALVDAFHQASAKRSPTKDIQIDCTSNPSMAIKNPPQSTAIKTTFINFTIFELDCLTHNWQKHLKLVDKLPTQLLKTYTHSVHIPKPLKQKIFRKIMRQNFTQTNCNITLKQFKEIIQLTDDPEQLQLFVQYVFANFGDDGRNMLMLMANNCKKIQHILLKENYVDI